MASDIKDIQALAISANHEIKQLSSNVQDDAIVNWLSPADPSIDYNTALKAWHTGTGQWLLDCNEYKTWKAKQRPFLWLNGESGRGKTVLSSTIIQDLSEACKDQSSTLLYFYFSFADNTKQSLEDLLRSLVTQLYYGRPETRPPLRSLYSDCNNGNQQPRIEPLQNVFRQMIHVANDIYIVIDALDEYNSRSSNRHDLLNWVEVFGKGLGTVRLLVTSRPEADIKSSLSNWASAEDVISLCTDLTGRDIAEYIHGEVTTSETLARWRKRPDVQEDIESTLKQKANGV